MCIYGCNNLMSIIFTNARNVLECRSIIFLSYSILVKLMSLWHIIHSFKIRHQKYLLTRELYMIRGNIHEICMLIPMGSSVRRFKIHHFSFFCRKSVVFCEAGSPRMVLSIWNFSLAGLWHCVLKCSETGVAFRWYPEFCIDLRCPYILFLISRLVSPTYWDWHFRHVMRYTTLVVRQLSLHSHLVFKLLSRKLDCVCLLKSISLRYLHVIVGHVVCLGFGRPDLSFGSGGYSVFAETSVSLRFLFLLKAHIGCSGNRPLRVLLQCNIGQYFRIILMMSVLPGL